MPDSTMRPEVGPRIINARAFATAVGASVMDDGVAEAMARASQAYVNMDRLNDAAGRLIAEATGAEAGLVTNCAAAGLVIAAAATLTGTDLSRIEALPDTRGFKKRKIVLQRGHQIKYMNMLRYAGAELVPFGYLDGPGWTNVDQLRGALDEETAAIFYVAAFHKVYKGELPLPEILEVSKPLGIPVIVDAAYDSDLRKWIAMGADLVTYSGGKFIGGPSGSGVLCGRADLIQAARMQDWGIGRPLKVGKEEIAGLMAALRAYVARDSTAFDKQMRGRLARIAEGLVGVHGIRLRERFVDHTGAQAWLLEVEVDPSAIGKSAEDVHRELSSQDPAILVREYSAYEGILGIDVTPLLSGQEDELVEALVRVLTRSKTAQAGKDVLA